MGCGNEAKKTFDNNEKRIHTYKEGQGKPDNGACSTNHDASGIRLCSKYRCKPCRPGGL